MFKVKLVSARTAVGASLCLLTIALATSSAPAAACSNASLKGVFGYVHGRPGGASAVHLELGQLTLDGQGKVTSGSWTQENTDGSVSSGATTGAYSVSKDCIGRLTLDTEDQSPFASHFDIYLNAGDDMFQLVQSDQNWNQPGYALAQGTVTCGLSGKKQVLTTNLYGLTGGEPADTVGQVTLDGKGGISGAETFTRGGVVTTLAVTGSYTEISDCTGTWKIKRENGATSNFKTVVVNGGSELLLIQTEENTFSAGVAQE